MEEENTEKTQGWSLQTHPGHSDPHPPGNVGPDLCSNSSTNTHTLMHIHAQTHTCTHPPTYTHAHTHPYPHTPAHTYTCAFTYRHTCTYTHSHTPAHTHTLHFPVLQTAPLTSHFHTQDRQLPLRLSNTDWESYPSLTPSPPPSFFPPHLVPVHPSIHLLRPPCVSGSTNTGNTPAPAPLGLTVQRDDRRSQTVVRIHGYQR